MSLATTVNRVQYTANGSTTVFSFPYKFNTNSDLVVIETNTTTGANTTKVLTTDYSVAGAGNSGGGSVTFLVAPVNSRRITIQRLVGLTQETDYQPDDDFPAEVHEAALDKLTMIAQQLSDADVRTLKAPIADSIAIGTLPVDVVRANKALVFDATGQVAVSVDNYTDQAAAAAASASSAASSASSAGTSAANAASSASAASSSETAAAASAAAAAASAGVITNVVTYTTPTGAAVIPTGTTAQRPTPTTGHFRFNSSLSQFEGYNGTTWGAVGGAVTGFRNRIINGDMRIDQKLAVGTGSSSQLFFNGTRAFAMDRFSVLIQGNDTTGQRLRTGTGLTDARQFLYQLNGASFITSMQFEQRIEASNCYDLAGQNVTISADLSNSVLTTVTWSLRYPSALDNFTTTTEISTGTWTVSSAMARYSASVAIPAGAPYINGLSLVLSVGAQVSGTWRIANVQLEPGLNATVFEHRPVGVELALCQRYYYQFAKASSAFALPAQRIATTTSTLILDVPVGMRTTPTAVLGTSPFGRVYARNTAFNTVAGNITSFTVAAAISSHVYQADLGHNTVNDSLNGFTFDTLGGSAPGIGLSAEL